MRQTVKYLLSMVTMVCVIGMFTACKDDSSSNGQPEITGVRVTNPLKADSLFTNSAPDSTIVIIGRNLNNALRVYINDQQVWFNSVFNTDHSIIVKIPSEDDGFMLTAFNSELKDEIRVETTHGTATYAFKIKAPYPQINRVQGRYPRKAGDVINIYGINLVDVEKIYFTDIEASKLDSTVWTEIGGTHVEATDVKTIVRDHHNVSGTQTYETTSQLSAVIPDLPYEKGSLVVQCTGGTVYFPFSLTLAPPTIKTSRPDGGISSDMPVPSEVVSIYGTEFVQVDAIRYGDVTLSAADFTVAETEDQIDFVFKKKPSVGSTPTLTVVTGGGEVSVPFYDMSGLLTDFEEDTATDNGWGPNATYDETDGDDVPYYADGIFARINVPSEGQQWWGTMIYFRKDWNGNKFPLPSYDVIPADASTDEVYLAMEVYNNYSDYNNGTFTGYLRYFLQYDSEDPVAANDDSGNANPLDQVNQYDNGFAWDDYDSQIASFDRPILADINNEAPVGKWYRHVLPLSSFLKYLGKDYRFVYENGINQFRIQSINQGTRKGKIDICIDNVRIFYKKK